MNPVGRIRHRSGRNPTLPIGLATEPPSRIDRTSRQEPGLSDTATRTGFDEQALSELPKAPALFVDKLRAQALEEFLALPVPSQETEEWRYTDLSDFDFGFKPWAAGGRATNLDGVPPQ